MRNYLNKTITNIFLDIKKLIDNIINDNIIISMKTSEYSKCINKLYAILLDTLKKIEDIYYTHILSPKLSNINKDYIDIEKDFVSDTNCNDTEKIIITETTEKVNQKNNIYQVILTTIVYKIIIN